MASKFDANPSRWTCIHPTTFCEGYFKVLRKKYPCPLYAKCRQGEREGKNYYEYPMTQVPRKHTYYEQLDPTWNEKHTIRRNELVKAFTPEVWSGYVRTANRKNRAKRNEIANEARKKRVEQRWEREIEERGAMWFGPGARHILLRCGEACDACPYGGIGRCKYTDEDEDVLFRQEYPDWKPPNFAKRAKRREYKRRRLAKLKASGLCIRCGKRKADPGMTTCYKCREDQRLKYTKRGW